MCINSKQNEDTHSNERESGWERWKPKKEKENLLENLLF